MYPSRARARRTHVRPAPRITTTRRPLLPAPVRAPELQPVSSRHWRAWGGGGALCLRLRLCTALLRRRRLLRPTSLLRRRRLFRPAHLRVGLLAATSSTAPLRRPTRRSRTTPIRRHPHSAPPPTTEPNPPLLPYDARTTKAGTSRRPRVLRVQRRQWLGAVRRARDGSCSVGIRTVWWLRAVDQCPIWRGAATLERWWQWGQWPGSFGAIARALPKVDTHEDESGGAQKFRVKLLPEGPGNSTVVLCQVRWWSLDEIMLHGQNMFKDLEALTVSWFTIEISLASTFSVAIVDKENELQFDTWGDSLMVLVADWSRWNSHAWSKYKQDPRFTDEMGGQLASWFLWKWCLFFNTICNCEWELEYSWD
jgi:hypothetical protein